MTEEQFKSLLKYYLSCIDAEEATNLHLRKNQENKSYIFLDVGEEALLTQDMPELQLSITDGDQKKFIEHKAPNTETLIDLYYGFPVFVDGRDMLSPLFFMEAKASFSDESTLHIFPKIKSFSINRMHLVKEYGAEETQRICEELEGEFGSFEARMKAAESYIPSLKSRPNNDWLEKPILFRTNYSGSRSGLRYDLTYLLKMDDAHSKETALKYFLQNIEDTGSAKNNLPILEVGLLNDQQEEAVSKGLTEPLSAVTGPPGTGKTQVVTALLASAVYNNETVLFSSNNNMPVDGVYDRLAQNIGSLGNWLMRLGNLSKRKACYQQISELLERVDTSDLSDIDLDTQRHKLSDLDNNIDEARISLKKAISLQGKISKLHNKEKSIEQKLPENWVEQFSKEDPKPLDEAALNKLKRHSHKGFWLWLRLKVFGWTKYREKQNGLLTKLCGNDECLSEFEDWLLLDEEDDEALNKSRRTVKYLWIHQKWAMCLIRRRRLEDKLSKQSSVSDIFDWKKQKSKLSQELFEKTWLDNISNCAKDAIEAFKGYFKDIDDYGSGRHKRLVKSLNAVKRFFPIWITTNQSTSAIMPPEAGLFDLVVIDEAGQCDIPSVIPLLYRAKRAVIIGDPHQFKHITSLKDDLEHSIAQEVGIDEITDEWSFTRRSAFDRSYASAQVTSFLKQHYRCHPDIIEFSNLSFYGGKLVKQVGLSQFQNQLPIEENGLIWDNTVGQAKKAKKGAWNPQEVEKTAALFDRWETQGLFADREVTYGVVTPFRKQVDEMRKVLSKRPWFEPVADRFTIGTAHSFQGSECDVLVYSPVVADGMESYLVKFAAAQEDLINVSVTRAKNLLYIIGDLHACQSASSDTPLHQLAAYAEKIRKLQKHPLNAAEKRMADLLDELKLSYTPQYEFGEYRLDFIMNSSSGEQYNIEVDGDIHLTADAIQHDERRDAYVQSKGMQIIRFAARDVMNKPELIKKRLQRM